MNWYKIALDFMTDEEVAEIAKSKWIPVDSSFIQDVAYYEPLGMFEVRIKGRDGRLAEYSFRDVPRKVFERFMQAESKGTFFNQFIRPKYSRD